MHKDMAQVWAKALRSGKYELIGGALHRVSNSPTNRHDCGLGVIESEATYGGMAQFVPEQIRVRLEGNNGGSLPEALATRMDITPDGHLRFDREYEGVRRPGTERIIQRYKDQDIWFYDGRSWMHPRYVQSSIPTINDRAFGTFEDMADLVEDALEGKGVQFAKYRATFEGADLNNDDVWATPEDHEAFAELAEVALVGAGELDRLENQVERGEDDD